MSVISETRKERIPTRYSLLSRLQDWNDHDSWKDFFDTYWQLIYSVAVRSGLTDSEAQDVVQETIISVAKHIHKFKRDPALGSFKSWLRNIIRWRIADQVEKRTPGLPDREPESEDALEQIPDLTTLAGSENAALEKLWEADWRNNLFEAALQRVKRKVREEHYLAFDLYAIRKWPVREVARRLGVGAGQVYLVKHRISALIRKEIRALEKEPLQGWQ